jgi:hypothetical protein
MEKMRIAYKTGNVKVRKFVDQLKSLRLKLVNSDCSPRMTD